MLVSVVQPGARLHYAAPQVFARAGLLKTLYTDFHASRPWARCLSQIVPSAVAPSPLRRTLGRQIPAGLAIDRVRDVPLTTISFMIAEKLGMVPDAQRGIARAMLKRMSSDHWSSNDLVYTVLINEDLETLRTLKTRGVRIIHECMVGPDVGVWIDEERRRFPGLEGEVNEERTALGRQRDAEKYQLADLVLVPSEFTRRAVLNLGANPSKVVLVPYGLDADKFVTAPIHPVAGRVLTVGEVGLRKGHPYLCQAARILKKRGINCNFRVAGSISPTIAASEIMKGVTYLGIVPRSHISAEFSKADVFVLPTLADSFSLAHLEALAHGVPVITTENCGSVVRDGVDGFIVPIRDPEALADKIELVVTNRTLRAELSNNAKKRAADYSIEKYGSRLLAVINSCFLNQGSKKAIECLQFG
jgi:glycosyltransferase involved in cell wall biosynthesis